MATMWISYNPNSKKKDLLGNLFSPSTSAVNTSTQAPVAKTPSNGYSMASGMTTQYAQNPTNYVPTVQKPAATVPDTTSKYTNSYLETLKNLANERATRESANAQSTADELQKSYERQRQNTQGLIPLYQQGFEQYKSNIQGGVANQEALAKEEEAKTRETYGEALRRAAQANRETQSGLQNTFAGLGTLDSSAFQQQALNQGNRFTAGQQSTLKGQARDIAGIYRNLGDYKRQASQAIDQENLNLQARIAEINNTLDKNSVEYESAIRKVYNDAFTNIGNIEQGIAEAEYKANTSNDTGKTLTASQVSNLGELDNSRNLLSNLFLSIGDYADIMGPVAGRWNSANPYNQRAQEFRSQMKAVAQMVGKAMEGGVLRQEDVAKYEAILPQISDTPEVAKSKIQNVVGMIDQQRKIQAQSFKNAGYKYVQSPVQTQQSMNTNADPLGLGI